MSPASLRRAGVLLTLLLGGVGCQNGCAGWNAAFERMVNQPKYHAYDPSEFYADGRAMRAPPAGTVPVERVSVPPAGDRIPIPVTAALIARGRDRFDIYCAPCHGYTADGVSVVAKNMQLRRPPSLVDQRIRDLTDAKIYSVVSEGYGLMPAYNFQLTDEERWGIVAYVRALQLSQGVPIVSLPPAIQQEAKSSLQSGQP